MKQRQRGEQTNTCTHKKKHKQRSKQTHNAVHRQTDKHPKRPQTTERDGAFQPPPPVPLSTSVSTRTLTSGLAYERRCQLQRDRRSRAVCVWYSACIRNLVLCICVLYPCVISVSFTSSEVCFFHVFG